MDVDRSRSYLERVEASLREAAGRLMQCPVDPGSACAALESAKAALRALRREWKPGDADTADACRQVVREAARVRRLLDGSAILFFRGFAAAADTASYTPAGEMQPAGRQEHFVFQG